ncbi:hypothetical protein GHNINEIG_01428 [Hydrogenovibrio crunogenus]|uniref:DUF3149 domain-containing protein n=1 Tax=Hydrogenovibrio crunogenus TaxID=39765 RepID=A0A4V1C8X0_9GAMM|nr:hypothetical protein [Hydrogenovibrio crunogenus]QBZ83374.1 hypothetical protein GHNINEIG_01428 [Hydrogenovibrio crunogenus]
MQSIGLDDVGSAIIITLGLLFASLTVVGLLMWWLYRVFKNKDTQNNDSPTLKSDQDPQKEP